jgi:hypothetical protein
MKTNSRGVRLLALLGSLAVILGIFFLFVRPWYLRWGATDEETGRVLPGDEIVANAAGQETRAITINAGVEQVWPWLAQIGQDRGGFYSFEVLENLVGCQMPAADRLLVGKQSWKLGDRLWMYPPDKAGGMGYATLRVFIPGRALGFGTHVVGTPIEAPEDGSWSFALEPIDKSTTRFLARGRGPGGRSLLGRAFDKSIFEPMHFVMERRMMLDLKELAEGGERDHLANKVHVILWMITFGLFVAAIVRLLRNEQWVRSSVGLLAVAGLFQFLTLGQPPVLIGIGLVVAVTLLLWWPESVSREWAATGEKSAMPKPGVSAH